MQLDEYQKKVIFENNNLLVLAGAGTGKTFCIVKKIEYLKQKFYAKNEDFLVVSFTNESVNDLKRKLNIQNIFTFHKLALNILKNKNYFLCNDLTLKYIIDEFFISMITCKEKRRLCIYFFKTNYKSLINDNNFKNFKKIIFSYIKIIKCNNLDLDYLKTIYKSEKNILFITIIIKIYLIYEKEKNSQHKIDLDDLIILASKVKQKFPYKYIFVDEFQDTSLIRFNLINNIFKNSESKIFLFGDDFQSIYHFSGCDINIMLNIKNLIKDIKIITLRKTFRNSQELINIANYFIMKNPLQISKAMLSDKHLIKPLIIIYYSNPKKTFNKLLQSINQNNLLILGRCENDINYFTTEKNKYRYLTVHKSKGLEADNVIIINVKNDIYGFPNKLKNYYLIEKINKIREIKYAEERRLFYVALTRTKNYVYILAPFDKPSAFLKEIETIIKKLY